MGWIEATTRTERRRTYSKGEKAAVVIEGSVPGATVPEVSQRLGITETSACDSGGKPLVLIM